MPIALLYHDVVARGHDDTSGFPGFGAARYKLTPEDFREHMETLARAVTAPPLIMQSEVQKPGFSEKPGFSNNARDWLLTFDDGGVSALVPTADLLEAQGWRGHFFITTDYLDTPTFLARQQIRDLHRRGHVIGSHSCSHPERLSSCAPERILREWRESRDKLEDILGEPVTSASVPGGFYSHAVARAAAQADIKVLFNSEPTTRLQTIDGCLIVGRYTVYRGMAPRAAAVLVQGKLLPRLRQTVSWNVKKMAKATGGRLYLRLRHWLLKRAYRDATDRHENSSHC